MATGSRREARERAVGLLYEAEMRDGSVDDVVAGLAVAPDVYAADIALGASRRAVDIDACIRKYLRNDWTLERLPTIDRIVLRLAVYELLERDDVPVAVVLSEAVELAKRYSTEESGRFVNGLLASAAAELRPTSPS